MLQDYKHRRLQWQRPVASLAGLFAFCMLALPCRAQDQPADCIEPAQRWVLAQAARAEKAPARAPENRRPITERELRSLIRAFESVPVPKSSGLQIRAAIEKSDLRADRADLLLRDVTIVLAAIQVPETLATLKQTPGIDPGTRAWTEKALGAIPGCARARFDDRGGERAYAATVDVIRRNRAGVEQMQVQMFRIATRTFPEGKR